MPQSMKNWKNGVNFNFFVHSSLSFQFQQMRNRRGDVNFNENEEEKKLFKLINFSGIAQLLSSHSNLELYRGN